METGQTLWMNGETLPADQPVLKANDLGLLRAYGVFDYCLVNDGKAVFVEEHVQRFLASCQRMKMDVPWTADQLLEAARNLIRDNEVVQAGLRFLGTGGYAAGGYLPEGKPNVLITLHPYPTLAEKYYLEGAKLITFPFHRSFPNIKTTNYVIGIMEYDRIQAEEAIDLLYIENEKVTEAVRSNFYIINDQNQVITANSTDVLPGITRGKVLGIAKEMGLEVIERSISVEEIREAREAFMSGTGKRVVPIVRVDDMVIANGLPGEKTKALMSRLQEKTNLYLDNN